MAMTDPADILRALEETADQLVNAVRGISDELARVKPAPDRWSVLDNVEHLVLVEDRYWQQIGEARIGDASFFDSTRAERYIGEYKSRTVAARRRTRFCPQENTILSTTPSMPLGAHERERLT